MYGLRVSVRSLNRGLVTEWFLVAFFLLNIPFLMSMSLDAAAEDIWFMLPHVELWEPFYSAYILFFTSIRVVMSGE